MKLDTEYRLTHLKRIKDEKYAKLRSRMEAVTNAHNREHVEKHKLATLQNQGSRTQSVGRFVSDALTRGVSSAEALVSRAGDEKAATEALRDKAENDWSVAGNLYDACLQYVRKRGLPEPKPDVIPFGMSDPYFATNVHGDVR